MQHGTGAGSVSARHEGAARGRGRQGAVPPAERLRPLIVWISSLHNLFTAACHGCGEVFPPGVASAALLLPPTARCAALKPYHEEVYLERFGRPAEEAFLEEARRRM